MTKPSVPDGFFALRDHCFAVFYKVSLPGDTFVLAWRKGADFIKRFSSR